MTLILSSFFLSIYIETAALRFDFQVLFASVLVLVGFNVVLISVIPSFFVISSLLL